MYQENIIGEQYRGTVYIARYNVNNRMNFATLFFLDVFEARARQSIRQIVSNFMLLRGILMDVPLVAWWRATADRWDSPSPRRESAASFFAKINMPRGLSKIHIKIPPRAEALNRARVHRDKNARSRMQLRESKGHVYFTPPLMQFSIEIWGFKLPTWFGWMDFRTNS